MPIAASSINLQYSHTIGRGEQFGPGFTTPVFVARGEGDMLYVLCRASEYRPEGTRITVCTVDEEYITAFARGVTAQGPHEFSFDDGSLVWPTAIAFDSDWNVYVTDEWLNRISIFTKDGDYIGKWEERPGSGDGELNRPAGIAIDADNNVYIADSGNDRIQKFTKDGKFLAKWGTSGSGPGQFNNPWGIALDKERNVYVADWRNDRIQKFTGDGQFLMQCGRSGSGEGELNRPSGVAVDSDGNIYVADWLNDRLQVFDADGNFATIRTGDATISKWAKEKLDANAEMWDERERAYGIEREKDFWGPTGVAVDADDRIFVCESARNRIQVYRALSPTFVGPRL
ncbi:MAG: 6-bladed beta-propeller [Candidatus Tectomicrobia bacterium]|uniref:6-bladed beta-propeller n=1 Tax=Tectimicrobiota bacterium TaxID=2528274 RepID=A0A937W2G6_UNCTE|nr:6-bladed beta-propeller [Candidatus Tectomicrobia bacterium]